jgi:hypothetical protein
MHCGLINADDPPQMVEIRAQSHRYTGRLWVIFGLDAATPPTAGLPLKAECRPGRARHMGTSRTLLGRLERCAPVDHHTLRPRPVGMAKEDRAPRVATDGIFNAVLAQSTVLSFDRIGTCNGSPSAVWYSTDIRVTTITPSLPLGWAGRNGEGRSGPKGGEGGCDSVISDFPTTTPTPSSADRTPRAVSSSSRPIHGST